MQQTIASNQLLAQNRVAIGVTVVSATRPHVRQASMHMKTRDRGYEKWQLLNDFHD